MALPISGFSYIPGKKYTININCKEQRVRKEFELDIKFADSNLIKSIIFQKLDYNVRIFGKANFMLHLIPMYVLLQ